jgi:hypothetical protein
MQIILKNEDEEKELEHSASLLIERPDGVPSIENSSNKQ